MGDAAGCGQGVVPGDAYEQPLLSFSGPITPRGGLLEAKKPIVSVLWFDPLQVGPDVPEPARWLESSIDANADTFTVRVFRPPPVEVMVDLTDASDQTSRLAVAEIVIIDDRDADGTFHVVGPRATIAPPDTYLAASEHVLSYVAVPYPSPQAASPVSLPAQSGFALINFACQGQVSNGPHLTSPQQVDLTFQPSQNLPDARPCRASHGP